MAKQSESEEVGKHPREENFAAFRLEKSISGENIRKSFENNKSPQKVEQCIEKSIVWPGEASLFTGISDEQQSKYFQKKDELKTVGGSNSSVVKHNEHDDRLYPKQYKLKTVESFNSSSDDSEEDDEYFYPHKKKLRSDDWDTSSDYTDEYDDEEDQEAIEFCSKKEAKERERSTTNQERPKYRRRRYGIFMGKIQSIKREKRGKEEKRKCIRVY